MTNQQTIEPLQDLLEQKRRELARFQRVVAEIEKQIKALERVDRLVLWLDNVTDPLGVATSYGLGYQNCALHALEKYNEEPGL